MEKNYLAEAFKAFDALEEPLNEEVFDITTMDGLEKAREFNDEIVDDEEIVVIDPIAETEEEVEDSYIGKVILKCNICQSMLYKDPEEVVISEDGEEANLSEVCPFCQSEEGFKVVGQVSEFCKDGECEEEHEEAEEEKVEEEPAIEEEPVKEPAVEEEKEEIIEEALENNLEKVQKTLNSLTESDKPAAVSIEDAQKWVDFDMKRYGKISARTNRMIKKAGFQVIKDDHGDYEVAAGKFEACEESLKEDFEKVEIETDREKMSMTAEEDGKVTVTTEPKEEVVEEVKAEEKEEEVVAPVEPEVESEFKSEEEVEAEEEMPEEEYMDIDFDEFEEKDFDELGEGYLKRIYENVEGFKTTQGSIKGNKLILEGNIKFKSGKEAKTQFVFEAHKATKSGKLKFLGENKNFAKGKKSFILTGKCEGKKLVCEGLTYNYMAKDQQGKSKRVYGTIVK